jgi:hypothetical protein
MMTRSCNSAGESRARGRAGRREGTPEGRTTAREPQPGNGSGLDRGQALEVKPSECQRGGTNPQVMGTESVGRLRKPGDGQRRGGNPCCT